LRLRYGFLCFLDVNDVNLCRFNLNVFCVVFDSGLETPRDQEHKTGNHCMSLQPGRQASLTALFLMILGCTILAGCAATASRLAVPYVVELHAMPDVNPGTNGMAAPIQLTVYELTSVSKFQSTDYFGLQ